MRSKKIVKLTGYTYDCNSLATFEYEVHALTGNGNQMNLLEKNREITSSELIFGEFYPFGTTVHYREPRGVETDRDASNCVTIWTYANLCVKTRRCSTYFTTVAANNP